MKYRVLNPSSSCTLHGMIARSLAFCKACNSLKRRMPTAGESSAFIRSIEVRRDFSCPKTPAHDRMWGS